ncbi:putative ribonuclease H-like domain-containing protein [Tanacetum coccineum]|uniref:Ribonuclease H-like domain-containing protein n=1 Tax=Tanacetum coccineum TaxID=301880 RepID=A0ABQ5IME7_9ASTR
MHMKYCLVVMMIASRSDDGTEFKIKVIDDFCREKGIKREYSVAMNPQQNGMAERRNRKLIEATRTMLADSKLPTTFWAEAVSTTCYVQNRVLVVKPYNKTPYELFRGLKPALSFMRPFGCHVTILNNLDNLGKFDGKSDEGTISNESAGTQGELNAGTSTQKEEISQDCIVEDGPHNESGEKDKSEDDSSPKEVNTAGQHVNTVSPEVNTGRFKLNIVDPSVNTASSYELDSPKATLNSYTVPTTPNTRIHKITPLKMLIGDVKSLFRQEDDKSTSVQKSFRWKQSRKNTAIQALNRFWKHVDLPNGKRAIETKWVFRNKKDERGIVIRNKARCEECILYMEPLRKRFMLLQPTRIKYLDHPDKDYKVTQKEDGIFISQDKYVAEILKKFNYIDVKSSSTLVDLEKPLVKYGDADDVHVDLYRSMIGSLMYLTASRPDIIYLKGKPTLGLWYSRDSPFELVAYTNSDYAGATQDRKSTTRVINENEIPMGFSVISTVHKELGGQNGKGCLLILALEAEQDSDHINRTPIYGNT